jgi:hypothetical protein
MGIVAEGKWIIGRKVNLWCWLVVLYSGIALIGGHQSHGVILVPPSVLRKQLTLFIAAASITSGLLSLSTFSPE